MSRLVTAGAVLAICGVALIVLGFVIGRPHAAVEGAYFDRPHGTYGVPLFSQSGAGLLDPGDGNLWIGAGVAALAVAAGLTVLARRSHI